MTYVRNKFGAGLTDTQICGYCHGSTIPTTLHNTGKSDAHIDLTLGGGGTWSAGANVGKISTADDSCANVACHSTTGTRYWADAPTGCDSCHEYPGSANDWTGTNGHTIRYTPGVVGTYNSSLSVTHLNVASAYNAATDTYVGVTSDVNKCGKCHPNTGTNHMDGFIELAPNGFGAGGGNFNITVGKVTGNTVQCSSVACHFSRTTPNWY
jgi:predicted CxxxxCH...CXXCH cytochrome family protein